MLAKKYKIVKDIYYKRRLNPAKYLEEETLCTVLKCPNGDCYSNDIICKYCVRVYKTTEYLCDKSGVRNKYVYSPISEYKCY